MKQGGPHHECCLGASLNVLGYRLAMIVSGGAALIWTDAAQGSGWSWPQVYRLMARRMARRMAGAPLDD